MSALANFTPAMINSTANENGWDTTEYRGGMEVVFDQVTKLAEYRVTVVYSKRCGIAAAWLHVKPSGADRWSGGDWTMLDGKAPRKRETVIRWLAGDFKAASQYRI